MSKYRMYIDEVGNSDVESSENPNHRFLSLTGVIIELSHVEKVIHPELENIKKRFFRSHPDDPIIFHRKEMLNGKPPFESLIDSSMREQFDSVLLRLLRKWEYIVITVTLDKKQHKDTYTVWRFDPYHYCLSILLERFLFFLQRANAVGDIMAESRGGKEDRRLKNSFRGLWEKGTDYVEPGTFQKYFTSKELKIKPKTANITGLQLADILAHPSRSEILHERNLLGRSLPDFGKKIVEILQDKYDRVGDKIYGKKML